MIKRISKRVVPLIAIVALMLNLVVAPQRARAVAVTAAVAASAAAILTACGVTYWASTQTDAVDYIAGKIDDYLDSLGEPEVSYEEWLDISSPSNLFEVVSGGVMRFGSDVANKLLDFCRWFTAEEGIESGGSSVGNGSIIDLQSTIYNPSQISYQGTATINAISSSKLRVDVSITKSSNTPIALEAYIPCTAGQQITLTVYADTTSPSLYYNGINRISYNYTDSIGYSDVNFGLSDNTITRVIYPTNDYWFYRFVMQAGYSSGRSGSFVIDMSVDDLGTANTATVTPTDFVNVPANISDGAIFAVTPSATLASGDTVEEATQTILDGITSEDGLTSSVEDTPNTAWGWLYTLLENIASTIGAGVSDIKDKLDGVKGSADNAASAAQGAATASQGAATAAQGAATAAQDAATAAQGVETAVEGLQSTAEGIEDNTATIARNLAPATYGDVADYQLDLTSLFPFCIPRDIYTAISLFASEPEAPSIDWYMPLPNGSTYHIHYDLSQWDNIASLLRHLELLLYGVGLMMATKSIIKW